MRPSLNKFLISEFVPVSPKWTHWDGILKHMACSGCSKILDSPHQWLTHLILHNILKGIILKLVWGLVIQSGPWTRSTSLTGVLVRTAFSAPPRPLEFKCVFFNYHHHYPPPPPPRGFLCTLKLEKHSRALLMSGSLPQRLWCNWSERLAGLGTFKSSQVTLMWDQGQEPLIWGEGRC